MKNYLGSASLVLYMSSHNKFSYSINYCKNKRGINIKHKNRSIIIENIIIKSLKKV